MSSVIFDASALFALIKNEPTNLKLETFLGNICMSSVNISEVASILLDKISYQECKDTIEPLINSIIAFDQEQSFLCSKYQKTN
ncbi:MAG: hypothetical protein ACRYE8_04810 [Janthinobacterium lividum]